MSTPTVSRHKRIAIFYYVIVRDNGIGKVNRLRLEHLCEKYDFTVFATKFDNPRPDRIRWVRVPCILRPALLTLITYWISAWAIFLCERLVRRHRFEIVQASDAAFGQIDIADAHFCSRHYLPTAFAETVFTQPRDVVLLLARLFCSMNERRIYRKASIVVVPSAGLRREFIRMHNIDSGKIVVMYPPVNTPIRPPSADQRNKARNDLGIAESDVVLLLVSAGDFQRKGLLPLIDALADSRLAAARLLVVGGTPAAMYSKRVHDLEIQDRVAFCGRHEDIQPFFNAADAFVLPSRYEVFPAVTIEAAAGALPLITTRLNGVEEYSVEGVTGFTIADCTALAIADTIAKFMSLPRADRQAMGCRARDAVQAYKLAPFLKSWDDLYSNFGKRSRLSPV